MKRNIVKIDEDKCNGCGICINACKEGALRLVDGKARLITDAYCDGLGACLPECPAGAIEIIEREAVEFDEEAVAKRMGAGHGSAGQASAGHGGAGQGSAGHGGAGQGGAGQASAGHGSAGQASPMQAGPHGGAGGLGGMMGGCPGSRMRELNKRTTRVETAQADMPQPGPSQAGSSQACRLESQLGQWPCQIKLVHPKAPYFEGARLLIAADCTAYAYANIHDDFMKGRITLIGCPKLDDTDYSEKLGMIFEMNDIESITVLRMEVPCCGGLVQAVRLALADSGKDIPLEVVTIGIDGNLA